MSDPHFFLLGTYTEDIRFGTGQILKGKGEGIYRYSLDVSTGQIEPHGLMAPSRNPSYLTVSPCKKYVYAVNELKRYKGKASGAVSAFKVEEEGGTLTLLNTCPSLGTDPCHVSTDDTGKFVFVANFMSGSVAVYEVEKNGRLQGPVDFVQHHGSSVDPSRQSGPHAHAVTFDPESNMLYVPDLGMDRLMVYNFSPEQKSLEFRDELSLYTDPAAGPRYLEIHPGRKFAYLINELDSTVSLIRFDERRKKLSRAQTVSLLPDGFSGNSTAADLHISPDGRFVYASNRGDDSITGFSIDEKNGEMKCIGRFPSGGKTPRNFLIDRDGSLLLVANQDSDNLLTFWIDQSTGELHPTGHSVYAPTPVCIKSF